MPTESVIRAKLSKSLAHLELGLKLVEVNHKLSNRVGTKGFIDILAKDRYGNFVIIELKRSDQAAREAFNEILKYMPLFREQHGIQPHQIRCLIVSTTWRELLTPYSEFRRLCECQTEGIEIKVNASGKVLAASRVDVHAIDEASAIFQTHGIYLYRKKKDRTAAKSEICTALAKIGAAGFLVVYMDCNNPRIHYPFAVYVVPTKVSNAVTTKLSAKVRDDLGDEADDPQVARDYFESLFLEMLSKRTVRQPASREWTYEAGFPMKFAGLVEQQQWVVQGIERKGVFGSAVVLPDPDLVEMLKGLKGDNPVRFDRLTSPRLRLDWAKTREAAHNCLAGNTIWTNTLDWFFDRVESTCLEANVHARIFNPKLLPEVLYHFVTEMDPTYLPIMHVEATSPDGQCSESLLGTITWDGKTRPKRVKDAFSSVPGGFEGYHMARVIGCVFDLDQRLMRQHGLRYSAWRIECGARGNAVPKQLTVSRTRSVREEKATRFPKLLSHFVIKNAGYIRDLVETTNAYVVRV